MRTTVVQSIRKTRSPQPGATYTREIWVGAIGGSALPTDPSPNSTPPSAGRIAIASVAPGLFASGGYGVFQVQAIGGTACTVQTWFFDNTQSLWVTWFGTQTITLGANPQAFINMNGFVGARIFIQITANTGVPIIGYGYF
jgi:hypothetical protein